MNISEMKKLLNGGSIVSACCNSYDRNKANGRITSFVEHFSVADSVLRQMPRAYAEDVHGTSIKILI